MDQMKKNALLLCILSLCIHTYQTVRTVCEYVCMYIRVLTLAKSVCNACERRRSHATPRVDFTLLSSLNSK